MSGGPSKDSEWHGRGFFLPRRTIRPAVKKGIAMGRELREDPASISPQEQERRAKLLNHQRAQAVPKEWT
jgi:hypothetical protein